MTVGIIVHRTRPEALTFAAEVIQWLAARDVTVRLDDFSAERLHAPTLACDPDAWDAVSFIITLGGDGTILTAARLAAPCGVPILGVHMGRFGFIAEIPPHELFSHLEDLLQGQVRIEERIMVSGEVWRNGERVYSDFGLNEVTVRSNSAHLLRLKTFLGDEEFASYPADGIVIATPTGSTAYALSAGGPLIEPSVRVLAIVPVCPHTLSTRPVIVPDCEIVTVEIEALGESHLAIDSVTPFPLQTGDRIIARRADYVTRLIILDTRGFYHRVRDRFQV